MARDGVDRRTKYREQVVAEAGQERRKQLQKIYEKNTTRISYWSIIFLSWQPCSLAPI